MSDTAITTLLDNIADLIKYHSNQISGAEGELQSLKGELLEMRSILEDASKRRCKEGNFKAWERKLIDVIYEVEDAIDTCIPEGAITKKSDRVKRLLCGKQITLAEKIKSLREGNVKALLDTVADFKVKIELVTESDKIHQVKILRNKAPRQDNVVAFEDETEKLIGFLLEESKGVDPVTIVGMPGLGKTTVAWKIYEDPKIKHEFPTLIWVVVSNEFNKREVLVTILKKFTNIDTISEKSVDDLEKRVKDYLDRTKFLLFLDDVSTPQVWKEINEFLPKDTQTSRVLITTHNENVGRCANPKRNPYKLRLLNDEESSMLLRLEVFHSRENFPEALEQYGKLIAKRCNGLPLGIVVIGGILQVDKTSKEEWRLISENTDIFIDTNNNNNLTEMISFSYDKLPNELRNCFLYLAMFPQDREISVWELTKLWIAEGFIKQTPNGKSLEATANDYLKELINMNLVMVDKIKPNGEVKTCRVHDTIREFCIYKAKSQNLFQEVKKGSDGILDYNENQKCRRLSIHSSVKDFFLKRLKATKLLETRSFLSFTNPIDLELKDIPAFIEIFELLRIFNAKNINFPKFPTKFTELVHLRYLTVSGKDLNSLPSSITKLWNLQTLVVDSQSNTLEIKANIWHMIHLRHVKTKSPIVLTCKDEGGNGGDKLQTLDKLSPESCTKEVFEKAKNLRTLGILGDISKLADSRCFEELLHLEKLKLVNNVNRKAAGENSLPSLPRAFPGKLRFLTLSSTYLNWSNMSTLGNITTLEVLKLKDNAFCGDSWDSIAGGFHSLEHLYITHSELMLWGIKGGGDPFPSLKTLAIKYCDKLHSVPKELVRKLDKLSMERVTPFAVKSAKEVEVERNKMGTTNGGLKLIIAPRDELY